MPGKKSDTKDRGSATLEIAAGVFVFVALILGFFHNNMRTNLGNQLIVAKKNALQQAQIYGGLTPAITQQIVDTLTPADADPDKIIVSSPQTTPVPLGGMIEIDISVTSNPTTGTDSSGNANQSTDTLRAKGYVVSQYSP